MKEVVIEFVNDWDEKEDDDDDDDDYEDYGDFDDYIGEILIDWIYDVLRFWSYWEELRKERYFEVFNIEFDKKDICNFI